MVARLSLAVVFLLSACLSLSAQDTKAEAKAKAALEQEKARDADARAKAAQEAAREQPKEEVREGHYVPPPAPGVYYYPPQSNAYGCSGYAVVPVQVRVSNGCSGARNGCSGYSGCSGCAGTVTVITTTTAVEEEDSGRFGKGRLRAFLKRIFHRRQGAGGC
jgi:hypothetical protein